MITTVTTLVKEIEVRTYKCEVCGKKSDNYDYILHCEKMHMREECKHENGYRYQLQNLYVLHRYCHDCALPMGSVSMNKLQGEDIDQNKEIGKIYSILEKLPSLF